MQNKLSEHNKSLLFLLALTVISSILAYRLAMRAYDDVFALSEFETELLGK